MFLILFRKNILTKMKILDEPKAIRLKIMDFLSRREHSSQEIFKKMSNRVESKEMLLDSIQELVNDGLLSDERFAESYFHSRKNKDQEKCFRFPAMLLATAGVPEPREEGGLECLTRLTLGDPSRVRRSP